MPRSKITAKGQVTIPKVLRDKLGVDSGDYLVFKETDAGYIVEKEVSDRRFVNYVGYLKSGTGSDRLIRELRGE